MTCLQSQKTPSQIEQYKRLLSIIAGLSNLFSENTTPFIHYRVVENLFCHCFGAENLSRSDTSYDARIGNCGIGIKTFILPRNGYSAEKIAEFDRYGSQLHNLNSGGLMQMVSELRNERISLANSLYGISEAKYHIVARRPEELLLYEVDYSPIEVQNLSLIPEKRIGSSVRFTDGNNEYIFNRSKSTLYRKFDLSQTNTCLIQFPIKILDKPFNLLETLWADLKDQVKTNNNYQLGIDYIVLPLYSTRNNKEVPPKSGLNQWNAGGRKRDYGEIYIPIPIAVRERFPNFLPARKESFDLHTPTNDIFSACVAQDGGKALMTNPNNALADWLLRKLFKLKPGELLTKERETILEFDSVFIFKLKDNSYKIEKAPFGSYEKLMNDYE